MHRSIIEREFLMAADERDLPVAVAKLVRQFIDVSHALNPNSATDLCALQKYLRVKSVECEDIPCDGLLLPLETGQYQIYLSSKSSSTRRRFSLAHEFAHIMLHKLFPDRKSCEARNLFNQPGTESEERLCDAIAAELLMPSADVRNFLRTRKFSLATIRQLADRFEVSLSAAARRLREFHQDEYFAVTKIRALPKGTEIKVEVTLPLLNLRMNSIRTGEYFSLSIDECAGKTFCGWKWTTKNCRKRKFFCDISWNASLQGIGLFHCNKNLRQEPSETPGRAEWTSDWGSRPATDHDGVARVAGTQR